MKDVRFALDPALWARAEAMAEAADLDVQEVMRQALSFALERATPRTPSWDEAWAEAGPVLMAKPCTTLARIALAGGKEHPFDIGSNPLPRHDWDRSRLVVATAQGIRALGFPWPNVIGGMIKGGAVFQEVIPAVWEAMQQEAESEPDRLGSMASQLMSALFLELVEGEEPEAALVFARTLPLDLVQRVTKELVSLHWGGQERSIQWAKLLEVALSRAESGPHAGRRSEPNS